MTKLCKISKILLTITTISTACYASDILFDQLPPTKIANLLDWVNAPNLNLCNGYYREPTIILKFPEGSDPKRAKTTITAEKQVFYAKHGDSILQGNVTITQPGRQLKADKIILHRDNNGKIMNADLQGSVSLREFGKLVLGNKGYINFATKFLKIDNIIYRMATTTKTTNTINLQGKAKQAIRDQSQALTIRNATYSTCQPSNNTWYIKSSKIKLDKKNGVGTLQNGTIFLHKIPIFYLPYFRFPIDKRRKTGFLYPQISLQDSGLNLALPFYLNLAPNYDATITPKLITKRGILFDGVFRYLTAINQGTFRIGYIYDDKLFAKFKSEATEKYPNNPALPDLKKSSTNRGLFSWQDTTIFNPHLTSNINLNYVTDDYYLHDLGSQSFNIGDNQLLNEANLNYRSDTWRFMARLQAFQTLHMVTFPDVENQYFRLPQLTLAGDFPNKKYGFSYHLNSELVNFAREKDFITKKSSVTGQRFNIAPAISWLLNKPWGYINPNLQLQASFYSLKNRADNKPNHIDRISPIFNFDSSLLFERNINLLGNHYIQTLAPRIFYLYVPQQNQDDIPIFDSFLTPFSFATLFRTNRFSGFDRIGDANQISLSLTSKLLAVDTGIQKFQFGIGQIFALQHHQVYIDDYQKNFDPLIKDKISPLIGQLSYYLNPNWNISASSAWDFTKHRINYTNINFQYLHHNSVVNLGYNYIVDGDEFAGQTTNLNRINFSFALPLNQNWEIFSAWNYNISSSNWLTYLYGAEYDSCCWAIRLVNSRTLTGYSNNNNGIFDNRFYIQFMFKGLGNIGNNDASGLLKDKILDFSNNFGE